MTTNIKPIETKFIKFVTVSGDSHSIFGFFDNRRIKGKQNEIQSVSTFLCAATTEGT